MSCNHEANVEAHYSAADPDGRRVGSDLAHLYCASSANLRPRMAEDEIDCFEGLLRHAKSVLEYGCGGSTVLAAALHCHIVSVDSDGEWLSRVEAQPLVRKAIAFERVVLKHVDVGPTAKWGKPSHEEFRHHWPRYSELPWGERSDYDLIVVDGRFRVACILNAVLRAQSDALIVVHDFWNRPEYHVVLPFLEWKDSCGTLGVFHKRRKFDGRRVQALIDEYRYIPD